VLHVRKAKDRGHANHGWLDSYHTFSFADYYDPNFMGFRSLRVINEDKIAGGAGFPRHGHRDMEIVTILLEGALEHKDTLGTSSVIRPGEVQRMTAGTGIEHSEFNHLQDQMAHLLQIWILPEKQGLKPGYEQKDFREKLEKEPLVLVGSRGGRDGSITIHQDIDLYLGRLTAKNSQQSLPLANGRSAWIQMAKGSMQLNGEKLEHGDGAAVAGEARLQFEAQDAFFLLFNMV
jgi:redox-sensitive bicupin YhaK (pirin superfamily)